MEGIAGVATLGALVWLIDGYFMWRRRARTLAQLVERGDLAEARSFLAHWRDPA